MKNLLILFGGKSSEHEVSCISAATIAQAVDTSKYNIIFVGITKDGRWLQVKDVETIRTGDWRYSKRKAVLTPDRSHDLIIMTGDDYESAEYLESIHIDVAFPALHGLFGEDGTIQGLFEMAALPYVGCGHLSSAITMDKFFTKIIADSINVAQADYVGVRDYEVTDENMDALVKKIEGAREYPMFIKPSCAGSSMGITKAHNRDELISGLKLAAKHDSKILVEESIVGREIECAVYGYGDDAFATGVGEILPAAEFYDFDAKYNNKNSETMLDPELPEGKADEIREMAVKIYRACDCFGLSRVDFFLEKDTNRVVFNEINTIPGHTSISMYPMLMNRVGHPMSEYINSLIELAYERHNYDA